MFFMRIFGIAMLWAAMAGGAARAADFRVGTDLVLVNATVLDRYGRPVRGLGHERFRVFENQQEQRVRYFTEEETPVSLVVVFDHSGSMEGKTAGARRALRAVLGEGNREDEFCLVTFGPRAELAAPWTDDAGAILGRAGEGRPHGLTSLLDAVAMGLKQFRGARKARRAMLILSDGGDNFSRQTERQIVRVLEEAEVQVYGIDMRDTPLLRGRGAEERRGADLLERLCRAGGGQYWEAESERELAVAAERIGKEIRSQYVLGYSPLDSPGAGVRRSVRLQLSGAGNLSVYWRRSYRAERGGAGESPAPPMDQK